MLKAEVNVPRNKKPEEEPEKWASQWTCSDSLQYDVIGVRKEVEKEQESLRMQENVDRAAEPFSVLVPHKMLMTDLKTGVNRFQINSILALDMYVDLLKRVDVRDETNPLFVLRYAKKGKQRQLQNLLKKMGFHENKYDAVQQRGPFSGFTQSCCIVALNEGNIKTLRTDSKAFDNMLHGLGGKVRYVLDTALESTNEKVRNVSAKYIDFIFQCDGHALYEAHRDNDARSGGDPRTHASHSLTRTRARTHARTQARSHTCPPMSNVLSRGQRTRRARILLLQART